MTNRLFEGIDSKLLGDPNVPNIVITGYNPENGFYSALFRVFDHEFLKITAESRQGNVTAALEGLSLRLLGKRKESDNGHVGIKDVYRNLGDLLANHPECTVHSKSLQGHRVINSRMMMGYRPSTQVNGSYFQKSIERLNLFV